MFDLIFSYYGMYFMGTIISIIIFAYLLFKNNYKVIDCLMIPLLQIIFALLFAIVFASIENLTLEYVGNSYYGTIFSLTFIPYVYAKMRKLNFLNIINIIAPLHMLMLMFMKIGCSITGCCYGITINGFKVPIQIIEAIVAFIIFIILVYIGRKYQYEIEIYPILLIVYGTCRFVIEFFRFHWDLLFDLVSKGQLWSIVSIILGIIIIIVKKVREKRLKMD